MRILILGGNGMLGHKLFQVLRSSHDVACTVRAARQDSRLHRIPLFAGADVIWGVEAEWSRIELVLRSRKPDVVINAIGVIKQRAQASEAVASIRINSLLPHQIAATVAEWGGRLIHFSTDCVFSGRRGHYTEDDVPDAADLYGRSKLLGEVSHDRHAVTLRTSFIGRELAHHHSLLDWFLSQAGGQVRGFTRVIYAGLTSLEMADVVRRIIEQHPDLHGLYQVAGTPIAKHDLLLLLERSYQVNVEVLPADAPVIDLSFSGERFGAATGYTAPPWPDLVRRVAQDPTPYAEWLSLLARD